MSYIIHSDPASMSHKTKMEEEKVGGRIDWERVNASLPSVTNSSDGLIFVKRRAKDGRFLRKNMGVRRAKIRAKFKLCIKKARKFDSRLLTTKVRNSTRF